MASELGATLLISETNEIEFHLARTKAHSGLAYTLIVGIDYYALFSDTGGDMLGLSALLIFVAVEDRLRRRSQVVGIGSSTGRSMVRGLLHRAGRRVPVGSALNLVRLSFRDGSDGVNDDSGRKVGVVVGERTSVTGVAVGSAVVGIVDLGEVPVSVSRHGKSGVDNSRGDDGRSGSGGRTEELGPLSEVDGGITISVDSSHDGEELALGSPVALVSEESAEVDGRDKTAVVSVDGAEGRDGSVIEAELEVSLEAFDSSGEVDFLLEDGNDSVLDVDGQAVETADANRRSIDGDVAENVVLAGEHDLDELLEGESLVAIAVEEADEVVGLTLRNVSDAVFSEEVDELDGGDGTGAIAINALESGKESEVTDVAESLATRLKVALAVSDGNDEVPELGFRHVTEHVSCCSCLRNKLNYRQTS